MKESMQYCANCEEERSFRFEEREQGYDVRGEPFSLVVPLWVCPVCDETIVDDGFGDPIEKAFDAYREKYGLLKPAEIQEIRSRWGLSQAAFAALLGMSQATINRYEQGSLQQEKEDELIRACANRNHMVDLLRRRGGVLSERQRRAAEAAIEGARPAAAWAALVDAMPSEVSLRSGFRAFDYNRYVAVVAWLCSNVAMVTQTKLYKLLFYADYLGYKAHSRSLTGALYRRMPYGPVPVGFGTLRAQMEEDEYVSVDEAMFQNGNLGEVFRPGPNAQQIEATFDENELRILRFVRDSLGGLTPSDISDRSHQEAAWRETPPKQVISYEKAAELSLSLTQ
jgi:putative zinc finger/helix-turn-helix YgiT family protein